MDIYHGWCDLKEGVRDMDFARAFNAYMEHLKSQDLIVSYRLTRRKLGLAPRGLGDFHFMIETNDLAQLDKAFTRAATREEPTETVHRGVNALVTNMHYALYRDFPDAVRKEGQERF